MLLRRINLEKFKLVEIPSCIIYSDAQFSPVFVDDDVGDGDGYDNDVANAPEGADAVDFLRCQTCTMTG